MTHLEKLKLMREYLEIGREKDELMKREGDIYFQFQKANVNDVEKIELATELERIKPMDSALRQQLDFFNIDTTKAKDKLTSQLRERRQALNLSQNLTAQMCGLDRRTINRAERLCDCSLDTFVRFATYLGYEIILRERGNK